MKDTNVISAITMSVLRCCKNIAIETFSVKGLEIQLKLRQKKPPELSQGRLSMRVERPD